MHNPLVSVIVPTFNSERYMEQCLSSIYSQKYLKLEVIIVDGKSTDSTLSIVRRYGDEISKIISEEDSGIYNAINKGIRFANGELIKILNSDDVLELGAIERAVEVYSVLRESGHEDVVVMGWLQRIDENGNDLGVWGRKNHIGMFENLLHPSWFVSASLYNRLGLYDESYKIASDYDYYMRILAAQSVEIVKLNEVVVKYRRGGTSSGFAGKSEVIRIKRRYKGVLPSILLKLQINLLILVNTVR